MILLPRISLLRIVPNAVGQAVALWIAGDKARFLNCRMLGFQDTLYTYGKGSRQYFYKCFISGTVDFIFGSATAIFKECEIFCKMPGYITAASTPDTTKYGYVFMNCKLGGSAPDGTVYLGRPWRPAAKTVFLNCELSSVIKAEGWHNWSKESNEKTAFYAEYKNKGIGAQPEKEYPGHISSAMKMLRNIPPHKYLEVGILLFKI